MPDSTELLEQWLKTGQELLAAHKGSEKESALEERLASIEKKLESRGVEVDDLDDAAVESWLRKTGAELDAEASNMEGEDADEDDDSEGGDDDSDGQDEDESRPRQRLTRQIPKIWSGADEPDHVEYVDEEGAVKVRPGRKKGLPYEWQVDEIEDDQADDEAA